MRLLRMGLWGLSLVGSVVSFSSANSFQAEKAKAREYPYPADYGPEIIDVSAYPEEFQATYQRSMMKCTRCHSLSRTLHSEFITPAEWERYVKRMMIKPGSNISPAEGKKIWEFLAFDSSVRKTGPNAKTWAEHRRKLLADFKAKHPDRYQELFPGR